MISKELLSAVWGQEVTGVGKVCTKWDMEVLPFWSFEKSEIDESLNEKHFHIAIEVIAAKCKEWANHNKAHITSTNCQGYYSNKALALVDVDWRPQEREVIQAKSEPEAIFKACQWILDNNISTL